MNATFNHIEIDTTPFERSHCKAPRGRGSWAFSFTKCPELSGERTYFESGGVRVENENDVTWFTPSMTYAEAKRWIKRQADAYLADREVVSQFIRVYALP